MRLATVELSGIPRVVGEVREGEVVDIATLSGAHGFGPSDYPRDMEHLLSGGVAAAKILELCEDAVTGGRADEFAVPASAVKWRAPIVRPTKVICINSNRPSARVDQLETKWGGRWPRPQFFLKAPTAVAGHREPIVIDRALGKVQPEGELCIVIGRAGRYISRERALDHIAGLSLLNDISASVLGLQDGVIHKLKGKDGAVEDMISRPLARAKGVDTFAPFGPWIVPLRDLPPYDKIRVTTRIAAPGEEPGVIQDGYVGDQNWSFIDAICFCSQTMTLEPGDVISMGSYEMAQDYYLRKGDLSQYGGGHIEIEATGLDKLVTPIQVVDVDAPPVFA